MVVSNRPRTQSVIQLGGIVLLKMLRLQLRGSKRPYFTKNPDELRIPQQIEDSDIFMETNLNSNLIVRISLNVILLFGYSEKDLIVEAH
jgi:hypothetical protein